MNDLFADPIDVAGVRIWSGYLDRPTQEAMVADIRQVAEKAPPNRYLTPSGHQMSVAMTAAGALGWSADRSGYRYIDTAPDGGDWPEIPASVMAVWTALSGVTQRPDSCLINYYGEGARMGLHQDRDEATTDWPVLSISLGDEALFRIGGTARRGPTQSVWLRSGDVALLSDAARLAYHGIDRIRFGSSDLLAKGGRLNLTLRVAG